MTIKTFINVQLSLITSAIILYFGKDIFIPALFSLLFAFILFPAVKWLNQKKVNDKLAIIASMFAVIVVFSTIITLFSAQIVAISTEFSKFREKVLNVLERGLTLFRNNIPFDYDISISDIVNSLGSIFSEGGFSIVSGTLGYTSQVISYFVLILVFTFLILLYRTHLVDSLTDLVSTDERKEFKNMLSRVQKVGQQYLSGMLLLILTLGVFNSVGLLIIGIDYAFFFGFLAALLAIIPYVGTFIGGSLPFIYALITYDSYWYPIAVILMFWFIQFLEGNFLNPKIVGGSLRINALFSIISLIAGGLLWGIAGMILFLPMLAILRVLFDYFPGSRPIAKLIGDPQSEDDVKFLRKLKSFFNKSSD